MFTMKRLAPALALLMMLGAACGGDDGVSIDKPWARASAGMANAGAAYMQLTSADGDRLIGASVDASIAGTVEVHETVAADMGSDSSDDGEGMGAMMMQEVGEIALPAGEMVSLEPGGYHVMLLNLAEPFEVGETFELTLQFESAGDRVVEVEVREDAP